MLRFPNRAEPAAAAPAPRPGFAERAGSALAFAGEVVAETLWPTRCALCDVPGAVLCERCKSGLPYLDWWRACRRCGAPFGLVQCPSCNEVMLARIGRDSFPFDCCASATMYAAESGRIVRVFKDRGEQRLAVEMGAMMARAVPPAWPVDAVTFVPSSLAAFRFRGFDHAELIARQVASRLGVPCHSLLARPDTRDQRKLTGGQRVKNLAGRFHAEANAEPRGSLVLVDDVFTTGATLCSATDALIAAGARAVHGLTFARV